MSLTTYHIKYILWTHGRLATEELWPAPVQKGVVPWAGVFKFCLQRKPDYHTAQPHSSVRLVQPPWGSRVWGTVCRHAPWHFTTTAVTRVTGICQVAEKLLLWRGLHSPPPHPSPQWETTCMLPFCSAKATCFSQDINTHPWLKTHKSFISTISRHTQLSIF